jgi:hypothetical protein
VVMADSNSNVGVGTAKPPAIGRATARATPMTASRVGVRRISEARGLAAQWHQA